MVIPTNEQLLDYDAAASLLGVKKNTLHAWVSKKKIPYIKLGTRTFFSPSVLAAWVTEHAHEPTENSARAN